MESSCAQILSKTFRWALKLRPLSTCLGRSRELNPSHTNFQRGGRLQNTLLESECRQARRNVPADVNLMALPRTRTPEPQPTNDLQS